MAVGCKLLFLYGLECKVCIAIASVNNNYLSEWCIDPVAERYLGIAMTFVSFLAIVFIIVRKMIFGDPVSGWTSLACIITFVGGIQLFCMEIMG